MYVCAGALFAPAHTEHNYSLTTGLLVVLIKSAGCYCLYEWAAINTMWLQSAELRRVTGCWCSKCKLGRKSINSLCLNLFGYSNTCGSSALLQHHNGRPLLMNAKLLLNYSWWTHLILYLLLINASHTDIFHVVSKHGICTYSNIHVTDCAQTEWGGSYRQLVRHFLLFKLVDEVSLVVQSVMSAGAGLVVIF